MSEVNLPEYGEPLGVFVQWKGTDLCADFGCVCGEGFHFDGYFAYNIRCPYCKRVFKLGSKVTMTETAEPEGNVVDGN